MERLSTIGLLGVLALVGCENMGIDYAVPAEEASRRPPPDLVAAVIQPTPADGEELIVDGRLWVPAGPTTLVSERAVRPIGSANGQTVYARTWDQAPYDELFTRDDAAAATRRGVFPSSDGAVWRSYLPVIGRGPAGPAHGEG